MDLGTLVNDLRKRVASQLDRGEPIGELGRIIADAEEEKQRHARAVTELMRRMTDLDTGAVPLHAVIRSFFDRPRPEGLDGRAARPKPIDVTPDQVERGVVMAYQTANPTFYRSVIERLQPGEKVRNVTTNHAWYEYTRESFERLLPRIAASPSYQRGSDTQPGKARYVTGRPPAEMKNMLAPDWTPRP